MKLLVTLLIFIQMGTLEFNDPDLSNLRALYYQAAEDKTAANKLSQLLADVNEQSAAILIGYKGASQMMEAKYAFNPITKLSRFNKGKTYIEKAIKKDPQHVELRFLRFSLQTNLPSFLGYGDSVAADKKFLLNAISTRIDAKLKQNIVNYLLTSKECTKEELKKLRDWQSA
jgi:hypothetical protein